MGGGGAYYERDVRHNDKRNAAGYSAFAAQLDKRREADPGVLFTRDRKLHCEAASPIALACDGTGSMGALPKIFFDRAPLLAGQLATRQYVADPEVSMSVIGDITSDNCPIQATDFTKVRHLDPQIERLFIEGGGGPGYYESYEFALYALAKRSLLTQAVTPFLIITGDEGFRLTLSASDLNRIFGENYRRAIEAAEVFAEVRRVYNDNVILLRRPYRANPDADRVIQKQWEDALGADYIVPIKEDTAVMDLILGILAVRGGNSNLDLYLRDMEIARDEPQTKTRIKLVEKALTRLAKLGPTKPRVRVEPDFDPEDRL